MSSALKVSRSTFEVCVKIWNTFENPHEEVNKPENLLKWMRRSFNRALSLNLSRRSSEDGRNRFLSLFKSETFRGYEKTAAPSLLP